MGRARRGGLSDFSEKPPGEAHPPALRQHRPFPAVTASRAEMLGDIPSRLPSPLALSSCPARSRMEWQPVAARGHRSDGLAGECFPGREAPRGGTDENGWMDECLGRQTLRRGGGGGGGGGGLSRAGPGGGAASREVLRWLRRTGVPGVVGPPSCLWRWDPCLFSKWP